MESLESFNRDGNTGLVGLPIATGLFEIETIQVVPFSSASARAAPTDPPLPLSLSNLYRTLYSENLLGYFIIKPRESSGIITEEAGVHISLI